MKGSKIGPLRQGADPACPEGLSGRPSQSKGAAEAQDAGRPMTAIALKVLSVIIFVAMSTLIKAAGELPTGQIAFYRSLFAIFPIVIVFAWRRQLKRSFNTRHPFSHVARGVVGVTGMWFSFYGLTRLPLPEAITINYAQPLIVVALSAIFLGEIVRAYRWSAVAVGFLGVVIVSWPNLTLFSEPEGFGQKQALGAVALLCAALVSGVAMLLVRRLVKTESSATIVLYFSVTATVLSLVTLPLGWADLSPAQLACLTLAGICGGVAQILLTESYRHAGMSVIAPFEYTSMLLAIVSGYFVFGDIPTAYTIVGGAIVIASGLFIIWREQRLGLRRGAARKLVPPQ
jgi:drug/metabolite transporter (DMT)-like permease